MSALGFKTGIGAESGPAPISDISLGLYLVAALPLPF